VSDRGEGTVISLVEKVIFTGFLSGLVMAISSLLFIRRLYVILVVKRHSGLWLFTSDATTPP
jgi:hypothetical protein